MYLALLNALIFFFKLIVMLPLRAGGLSHYPAAGRLMSRHGTREPEGASGILKQIKTFLHTISSRARCDGPVVQINWLALRTI